ncbi:hypothetical protein KXQ82_03010 [Mucilaginibacter sp. HMF5004]|uniref:hypothetical protein n=1 Tax=Mucilaginibacter rivuli TaxID=2857527 RepID=UPI001C5F97D7|nr:hypothetical protein [Mucilaginibacter rivuli]MBW4888664.1 hypothetical protein [Mucilaginibacter rivuli]
MKVKYVMFSLMILYSNYLFARSSATTDSIKMLNSKIIDQQAQIDRLNSLIQTSNGSIANSISGSQHYLSVFTVLFSLLGILIGIAITYLTNRASHILRDNRLVLEETKRSRNETIEIQDNVKSLSDTINNNLGDLYVKLQDEELIQTINILTNNPDPNLVEFYTQKLYSRPALSKVYFEPLMNMAKKSPNARYCAIDLLFIHYKFDEILKDEEVAKNITTLPNSNLNDKYQIIDYIYSKYCEGNFAPYAKIIDTFCNVNLSTEEYENLTLGNPDNLSNQHKHIYNKFGKDFLLERVSKTLSHELFEKEAKVFLITLDKSEIHEESEVWRDLQNILNSKRYTFFGPHFKTIFDKLWSEFTTSK